MTPLPAQWTRNGLVSRVIKRTGDVVMVQLGKADCYEVAIVQRHNGRTLPNGVILPPAEHMPSTEEFGRKGWYYPDRDMANAKYRDLVAAQDAPKSPKRGHNSRQPIPSHTPGGQIAPIGLGNTGKAGSQEPANPQLAPT